MRAIEKGPALELRAKAPMPFVNGRGRQWTPGAAGRANADKMTSEHRRDAAILQDATTSDPQPLEIAQLFDLLAEFHARVHEDGEDATAMGVLISRMRHCLSLEHDTDVRRRPR